MLTQDTATLRILDNYSHYDEEARLKTPYGLLEEQHTRELLLRSLGTSQGARILDIGGGTGPYAFWLASLGHEVHLLDLVPRHIERARAREDSACLASIQTGDARQLPYPDGFADFAVLNGPLYHLISESDRLRVLRECHRVLRPGGAVLAFAIGRLSGLLYALNSGAVFHDDYFSMVQQELATGVRDNTQGRNRTFVEAYFHTPADLSRELTQGGFVVAKVAGVLGQAWNVASLSERILDPASRQRLMEVARLMEAWPDLGPKILAVGRKEKP